MAAASEPLLMTVEQFRELPEREDVVQELQWGQVVTLHYRNGDIPNFSLVWSDCYTQRLSTSA